MKQKYDLDSRDLLILQKLSEEIDGLRFNELQRRTGLPRQTLTRHLATLEKIKIINNVRKGKNPNSPSVYKTKFDGELRETTKSIFENSPLPLGYEFEDLSKIQLVSTIPHIFTIISLYHSIWIGFYITNEIERAQFQFATKALFDLLDKLKIRFKKLLNKEDFDRLKEEMITVGLNECHRAENIADWVVEYTKKYRTVEEIVRDLEIIIQWTDTQDKYHGSEAIDPRRWNTGLRGKKLKRFWKLEEDFVNVRNQLAELQLRLKAGSPSRLRHNLGSFHY